MADLPSREEFPANSVEKDTPAKTAEKRDRLAKFEPKGSVSQRTSMGQRMSNAFIAEEATEVRSYIIMDVIVPALKDMIADTVKGGIDRLLYGAGRRGSYGRPNNKRQGSFVSYEGYSSERQGRYDTRQEPRPSRGRRMDQLTFTERADAEEVRETLLELIDRYGVATVDDVNELLGITGDYMDSRWGWTNLAASQIRHYRGGYILDFPKPRPVD